MNYDQNDCPTVFFHNHFFLTLSDTLKTKVGDVVGCIFEVECTVGGFLILKQIIYCFIRIKSGPFFDEQFVCIARRSEA
jgi:hypothetical protein